MNLTQQTLFRMMNERMGYLSERQKVLAQNVANADTPNYQARDLKKVNFFDEVRRSSRKLQPAATQGTHLAGTQRAEHWAVQKDRRPYETSPDKNGVVLEEQMMKIANNQADYQMSTTLYRKYLEMMKTTLSRG